MVKYVIIMSFFIFFSIFFQCLYLNLFYKIIIYILFSALYYKLGTYSTIFYFDIYPHICSHAPQTNVMIALIEL